MSATKIIVLIGIVMLAMPQAGLAVITFDQLTNDTFIVSHRVKIFGSRGQAVRKVYEKSASLCWAAGYTHLEIRNQESEAYQPEEAANASVRVRFFSGPGEERIDCNELADDEYVQQATAKLQRKGYQWPSPAESSTESAGCTPEQVSAMEAVALSAKQIEAACEA